MRATANEPTTASKKSAVNLTFNVDLVTQEKYSPATHFAACAHTLSTHNGKEFSLRAVSSKALNAEHFFAHPYCSWERGANANMNGFSRKFFPTNTLVQRHHSG